MNPVELWGLIRRTGRIAQPAPARTTSPDTAGDSAGDKAGNTTKDPAADSAGQDLSVLAGSVQVRHVDCGSCNGCEIEIGAAFGPVYDAERYGARLVASPRHADVLVVTGVVTRNMARPLVRTVEATPRPRVVVAVGDCAAGHSVYAAGYAVDGSVADHVEVDLVVPGCPPSPDQIIEALRRVTRR
ncbi:MAG: oxidoreductase [Candidatus Phosphoribacter sp.]|nr:oxidoreductase [Actinomycetales bacterium]